MEHSLRGHDNCRVERLASWRRLVRCHARHHHLPDSTRFECGLVGYLFWLAITRHGFDRNYFALDGNPRQHNILLENLNSLRQPSRALPGVGDVRDLFECGNLAAEQNTELTN